MSTNAATLAEFMELVWNRGEIGAVDRFLADDYTIHSDPGDPWDGKMLSRDGFKDRLVASRAPFPDLKFEITDSIEDDDRVAIAWRMTGRQTGPMGPLPATGRQIDTRGMTIYYFRDGRITGHRQVVDRLTVAQQLGLAGSR